MGYALVAELVLYRPPNPGREWWLLLDLALDADDKTRRTMPGYDYMARRTQAPRSTIFRWLASLHDQGLIRTVEHSAGGREGVKGRRAVYEIQVPPRRAARIALQVTGLIGGDLSPEGDYAQQAAGSPTDRSHPAGPDCGEPVRRSSDRSHRAGPPITEPQETGTVESAALGEVKIDSSRETGAI